MELTDNARVTLERRYLQKNSRGETIETPEDMLHRVATNIAQVDGDVYGKTKEEVKELAKSFYRQMDEKKFIPNSPTLMNAGRELQQLSACFVLPINDSMESIFETLKHMALVQKTGGGTGFSFDHLRPAGDFVKSTNGVASGPVSFLKIYDAGTEAVKQGGTRRGANMGTLRYDHPDIISFIKCKTSETDITNFNISVPVSDEFMKKAIGEDPDPMYYLINPRTKEPYVDVETGEAKQLNAVEMLDLIADMAWKNGDPGLIFIDRMNEFNPTPHIGKYETTNPCVSGDTFVLTTDGPRMVTDLVGKCSLLVINGKPYRTTDKGFFPTGVKPLLSIKAKEGYTVRVTKEHPIRRVKSRTGHVIEQEWIKAGELKAGDKIMLHNHRDFIGWNGLYGKQEGYLIGLLMGDKPAKDDEAVLSLWEQRATGEIMDLACGATMSLTYGLDFTEWQKAGSGKEHGPGPAGIRNIAFSLGIKPKERKITTYLETGTSSDFIKGFLRGLFDADGSVQGTPEKGVSIRLAHSDLKQLQSVQRMLARLGIVSAICTGGHKTNGHKKETALPTDGITGGFSHETQPRHELTISKDNIRVFADLIGFSDGAKKRRLESMRKSYGHSMNREHFTIEIDTIVPDGTEQVFDVQVPGVNAFDANGIVVHNCGEQPLLPYEACCLGSINLNLFVDDKGNILWDDLKETVHTAVHFEDNVIDATKYVIPQIEETHKKKNRKIGLGIMGWHDMLVQLGIPYDSEEALDLAGKVMKFINDEAKNKSMELARERGPFPSFEGSIYDKGNKKEYLRNATRTTIAPTGTISIIAGASSGIEPYFSIAFMRKNVLGGVDLPEVNPLFLEISKKEGFYSEELIKRISEEGSVQNIPEIPTKIKRLFKTALEIDYTWHVKHQAAFQQHTDNAVSKTINMKKDASKDDVKKAYILSWKAGCKGITVYRDGSRSVQVLNVGVKKETSGHAQLKPLKRPQRLTGVTIRKETPMGNLFVTLNKMDDSPFEIFAQIGKAGSDILAFTEAIARLISLALRCEISADEIIGQLEGIGGGRSVGFGPNRVLSVPDAIGKALCELLEVENNKHGTMEICPECGQAALIFVEGCAKCQYCGYSEC